MTLAIPAYTPGGQQRILGFPMNQNRYAVPAWSYLMEVYPPTRIIEIGSYNGGFTLALALHCWNIGAQIISWDICVAPSEHFQDLGRLLKASFTQGNVFDRNNQAAIAELVQNDGVTYLLCDGGDKPKEFNMFAKFLKPGDVIAAHDYCVNIDVWGGSEISQEHVIESVKLNDLAPFHQDMFDQAAWLCFRRERS